MPFLDRRAKLNTDFDNLWAKVYKDAGYGELPEKPVNPLGDSVHSGIDSPDLHEEIFETNSHGKSTQLAGADFIGGTMTMWRADQNGSKSVHAQAYLPPKKQEELLGWLQARSKDVDPDKSDPTGFGSHDVYGDAFIGAAKTINHHITKGDTDYNQTKISEFEKAADLLQKDLDAWEPSLTSNVPDGESYVFPSGQKIPMQQVDQYKLLLDHYYPSIENINSSKVAGDKITHLVNYAPISLDFPIKQYVNGDGEKYTKLADGTWLHNDGTTVKIVPSTNFTDEIEKGEHGFSALQEAKAEREKKNSIKVFYGKTHDLKGSIDSDGTLVYSGTKLSNGVAGSEYEVQLPTGEKIYFRNSSSTGTLTSQAGKLSIYIPNVKDQNESQASMQRVQAVLTEMGLHTDGADEDDAELSYWREMMTILTSRKHVPGSAYAKALADLEKKQQEVGGDPKQFIESMDDKYSVTEQNQFWRSLWGKYFGDDKVENLIATQGYLPKYEKSDLSNPEMGTGKPYWERFDVDTEEIAKQGKVLASAIGGSQSLLVDIVKSGSALSTEERIRYYGRFIGGMSSETDQSYGSGHNVYTRIVSKPSSNQSLIYHPKVFKRTRTYSFRTDMYGKPHVRKDYAPSNPLDAVKGFGHNWGGSLESNNETNIPDSASLFDSLEMIIFDDNEKLAEAIKVLKEKGIEKIRGLPIEDRLIMRAQYNEKIAKVKATWAQ